MENNEIREIINSRKFGFYIEYVSDIRNGNGCEIVHDAEMRWEYDQMHMNRTEWDEDLMNVKTKVINKTKKVLPEFDITYNGSCEKGRVYILVKPKSKE